MNGRSRFTTCCAMGFASLAVCAVTLAHCIPARRGAEVANCQQCIEDRQHTKTAENTSLDHVNNCNAESSTENLECT